MYSLRVAQIKPKLDLDDPLRQPRLLAAAYVLYGLVATVFLAINMPPFQNPDEPSHFLRAAQLADGGLVGTRFSTTGADGLSHLTAGGLGEPGIIFGLAPRCAPPFPLFLGPRGAHRGPPV